MFTMILKDFWNLLPCRNLAIKTYSKMYEFQSQCSAAYKSVCRYVHLPRIVIYSVYITIKTGLLMGREIQQVK